LTAPDTADDTPGPARISKLRLTVVMDDDTEHDVTVANPDMIRFDRERERRKLPLPKSAPVLWQTFVAWAALTRTRALDGMPWEAFCEKALFIDQRGPAPVDPTPPGHGPG
jgi:hypothetical protein